MRADRQRLAAIVAILALMGSCSVCVGALRDEASKPEERPAVVAEEVMSPRAVREEKLGILRKVAAGELSPEAALDKLEAVEKDRGAQAQWIAVEITKGKDRDAVKMSFPLALGEWGLRVAAQQGGEMLRMMGIEVMRELGEDAPLQAQMVQKAAELLASPEGKQMLTQTIEILRAAERGHTLFDVRDGDDHVRVYLD